jgi:hypothetical protein
MNRRSFDCGNHDETVIAFAQDDTLREGVWTAKMLRLVAKMVAFGG